MLISAILLASAASSLSPASSPAPSPVMVRQEEFSAPGVKGERVEVTQGCTRDRGWCVTMQDALDADPITRTITVRQASGNSAQTTISFADQTLDNGARLWAAPVAYRTSTGRDGLLFGIITRLSEGYSGGGADAATLELLRAEADISGQLEITPLGDPIPFGASAMIRACFSERDMKLRRNICHDEYALDVTLKLQPKLVHDLPAFLYISKATATPGFAARNTDNSDNARLKKLKAKDFKTRTDMRCTFTRPLQADARRAHYLVDAPDCSAYGPMME